MGKGLWQQNDEKKIALKRVLLTLKCIANKEQVYSNGNV